MPKHYKEVVQDIVNRHIEEDAPTNSVAGGGVDMNPTGKKVKKKDDAEDVLRRTIMKKLGANIKENFDNNNVVLRGVNKTLSKLENKIDEYSGNNKEIKLKTEKKTFHDKFMKDLMNNTPHAGQFDEKV